MIVKKKFLDNLFRTKYLYKNEIASKLSTLDYHDYSTPKEMINAYKYNTLDKWSYSETFQEYEEFSTQITSGFGCYYQYNKIKKIDINSPCDIAGIKRGDTLEYINNQNITSESYNKYQNNLNNQVIFNIKRYNNNENKFEYLSIPITPKKYNYKASYKDIKDLNGNKIGLFIYDSFSARSTQEIDDAFTYFKNNNIKDIIIDLRYNGGGSVNTCAYFLDKLVKNKDGQLQFTMKFINSSDNDEPYYFQTETNSIDFNNIIFLTTHSTASASELLINALKPYTNVSIIGTKTHGKPVGMRGENFGDKLIYWLINFSIYNANNQGDYYDGLDVTCEVNDEIDYDRNNNNDNLLKSALNYLETGTCN